MSDMRSLVAKAIETRSGSTAKPPERGDGRSPAIATKPLSLLARLFRKTPQPSTFAKCLAIHVNEAPNKSGVWSI